MTKYAIWIFIGLASTFIVRQEPGPATCANLTSLLSTGSVVTSVLDPNYISSRYGYWNARLSNYEPSCVVYPKSAQDVSVSLQAIRASGSRFAIKAGGHNPNAFFSSVDQGVLIDFSKMTAKSYDANTTLATYEPGNKFGDLYDFYYEKYGRTVVGARLSGVGSGLALSGGLSFLSPQYGMACDSFRSLEIVLPSGEIVTASPQVNPDLFFASRGGGGNAYGVVTKYTVQSRAAGTFYAGNVIYAFEQTNAVIKAIHDFTKYNTDPKASIIGTYEKITTPDLNLNLDEAVIMFLVYDGPNPGESFKNFTDIPHLLNTMAQKNYPEVANMPLPFGAEISRGDNIFRVGAHRIEDQDTINKVLESWRSWAESNKGSYLLTSLDFQPVPKSLTDASNAYENGNAMQMPGGPWFWVNYLITTPPGMPKTQYDAIQASFRNVANSVPSAEGLPLFISDANADQNPLRTYGGFERLKEIKKKFDPDGFFTSKTGGWSFE